MAKRIVIKKSRQYADGATQIGPERSLGKHFAPSRQTEDAGKRRTNHMDDNGGGVVAVTGGQLAVP